MPDSTKNAVLINMLVTEQATEKVRCVRLATGQVVYEFWNDGSRVARVDANAYELALSTARDNVQDEERPDHAEFATAQQMRPERSGHA